MNRVNLSNFVNSKRFIKTDQNTTFLRFWSPNARPGGRTFGGFTILAIFREPFWSVDLPSPCLKGRVHDFSNFS